MDLLEPDGQAGIAPVSIMATFGGNSAALAAGAAALERSLHLMGYVGEGAQPTVELPDVAAVD